MTKQLWKHALKNKLLSLPYRTKLVLVFSLLILLTAIFLGSITYYHFAGSSQKEAKEYQIQLAEQINRNIDRYLKEMQIISLSPLYDQEVLNILNNHLTPSVNTSFPPANERIEMWRYISSLIHMRNEIKGIHIMGNDGTIFSNLDSNTVMLKVFDTSNDWVKQIKKADGERVILPLHHPNYYLDKNLAVFSVARLIREPSTNKPLGMIKIDLKQELIEEIISNTNTKSNILILDNHNQLIYPNKEDKMIARPFLSKIEEIKMDNYSKIPIDGIDYMMVYNDSDYSGIKVIMLTPRTEILSEVNQLRILLCLAVLCGIAISFILGFVLSKPLVRSIHTLQKAMAEVEKGNLSKRVESFSDDEIGQLGKGFNHMVDEIDRLVSEVYRTSLREKEAEIRALQSQMNPHFLYNTLESINMLAITNGNLDVSDMVTSLGKLLRYTIDNSAKIVTLQEELSFIHSYITIQQVRMGESLRYREDVDPMLRNVLIPKLMLQPLIENSIVHGIAGEEAGLIHLKARACNEELQICVSDNGKGVNGHILKKLKESLQNTIATKWEKHNGIALPNVNERIKILYGKQYGINIHSELKNGFSVNMTLPIQRKENDGVERSVNSRR
ncbi:two-component sensor histidine kinase [Bacillus sp. V3-13]|uniref:sensor histidine kinase n=1 Tax=Bacillus sp. V3-13 TaxID=2053728 RepID=UPI000C770D9A|nr:sensor histidine kinase [Bacillus sp. V3-13]PLR78682.1 two-component sensor histidine kinase [Bacillus sp. V3-13]